MKQLFTFALACACLSAHSQSGLMPYNPDSNGDALIGSEDLISLLGVYNTLMIDSSQTCDYDGTEFETWYGGLFDGTIILDSVYVEYLLIDSSETYLPGCPDPVIIETVLERSYMFPAVFEDQSEDYWRAAGEYLGYWREVRFVFNSDEGYYFVFGYDYEIDNLTSYSPYYTWNAPGVGQYVHLPFPENWTMDGDGIQVEWHSGYWAANCEHFRLIPFWHEAE